MQSTYQASSNVDVTMPIDDAGLEGDLDSGMSGESKDGNLYLTVSGSGDRISLMAFASNAATLSPYSD